MASEINVVSLVQSQIGRATSQCRACSWLEDRPVTELKAWDEVMADRKRYPHAAIHRAMLQVDPECPVGRGSIENHRINGHRR